MTKLSTYKFRKNKKFWIFVLVRISYNDDGRSFCIYYFNNHWDFISEWVKHSDIVEAQDLNVFDYVSNIFKIQSLKSYITN